MIRFIWANAALLPVLFVAGCQQTGAPTQEVEHASGTRQSAPERPAAQQLPVEIEASVAGSDRADEPDDPGMTAAHDKTPRQEQPSGDESSRAAPNDGDAEPPQ